MISLRESKARFDRIADFHNIYIKATIRRKQIFDELQGVNALIYRCKSAFKTENQFELSINIQNITDNYAFITSLPLDITPTVWRKLRKSVQFCHGFGLEPVPRYTKLIRIKPGVIYYDDFIPITLDYMTSDQLQNDYTILNKQRNNVAAHTIQVAFRTAISNPEFKMCRNRLFTEFTDLN